MTKNKKTNPQSSDLPSSALGKRTHKLLLNIWEPIDLIGHGLMNDLWRSTYMTIQDAIALSVILHVPGLIGKLIVGKDYSSFEVCLQYSALSVNRYACFIIVISGFSLWIILAGRIIGHFWRDLTELSIFSRLTKPNNNSPKK